MHIQFDGTFFTVPILFTQLWAIFVTVGRHPLQAIHCLMKAKNEKLYTAVLEKNSSKFLTLNQWLQSWVQNFSQNRKNLGGASFIFLINHFHVF